MRELLLSAVSPSPTPNVVIPDEVLVTPGPWGFIITFGVAVLAIALFYDMVRRMRRVRYRQQIRESLEAEGGTDNSDEASAR